MEVNEGTIINISGLPCQLCEYHEALPIMVEITPETGATKTIKDLVGEAYEQGRILCSRCEDVVVAINEISVQMKENHATD